ncbi:MAG: hypothetical protein ACK526_15050 [Planctomyces sp.]
MDEVTRIQELRRALTQSDTTAYLVQTRVIRRVIRELHGYARLSTAIPHTDALVASSADLRRLCHPDELGRESFDNLSDRCILIAVPDEDELQHWPVQELMQLVWRRLFHGTIDRHLQQLSRSTLNRATIQSRIAAIGQVEFDEAQFVLRSESRLIHSDSRMESYCEFAAVYLELHRFAPDLLPVWFPSLAGRDHVHDVLRLDVDAEHLYQSTRLYGAPEPDLTPNTARDEQRLVSTRQNWSLGVGVAPSDRAFLRLLRRRDRANEKGNTVRAAVSAVLAVERATTDDKRRFAQERAGNDISFLAQRLQRALKFADEELPEWKSSLQELVTNSVHGFWNSDKRLLYDLQKVCLDHERVIYKVDVVKWIVSRGRRPLRRPLDSIREVMMAKHLASSASRLASVRLSGIERERLDGLLHEATHLAELQMRERMRPAMVKTMNDVGLVPTSLPEQVAQDKLIEESLDCIAERGYLTMGYLRDAISRNDLKLPDLKHPMELIRGDHLLRSDDRLDVALDGVYRRGEFYLRWLQITSAMFFGTGAGRFITLYLILPFGGALVIVEISRHVYHVATGKNRQSKAALTAKSDAGAEAKEASLSEAGSVPASTASETAEDTAAAGVGVVGTRVENKIGASKEASAVAPETVASNGTDAADGQTAPATGVSTAEPVQMAGPLRPLSDNSITDQREQAKIVITREADPVDQIIDQQGQSFSMVLIIGCLLLGVIHSERIRRGLFRTAAKLWKGLRVVVFDGPLKLIRLPIVQMVLKSRLFVRFRQWGLNPFLAATLLGKGVFPLLFRNSMNWWWVSSVAVLMSLAINSRLGRDAEELTAEWLGNLWYDFRVRVIRAVIEWIIDAFKIVLGFIERCLYAVDELLRFHSEESWMSVVAKAAAGIVWSFVSFLIRIYVNLLIEPTLHPVKHFPVVTVAHKMFFPAITYVGKYMLDALTPYLGVWLAGVVTGFNIFFLPGIFGFLVWEMKENWRLYAANRHSRLTPAVVGSHGESVPRLMKPGFHSGTLPKLFRRMRRLEKLESSFSRFSSRRSARSHLEHVERDVRRFAERELIQLLQLCPVWKEMGLKCGHIHAASNSIQISVRCGRLSDQPLQLLFQEQSGWAVAAIAEYGWVNFASAEQIRSLEHALEGFYRKAGVELVREQIERNYIGQREYDINATGLSIWADPAFEREITVDLHRRQTIRPSPHSDAIQAGLSSIERDGLVFSESKTDWKEWEDLWRPVVTAQGVSLSPPACSRPPQHHLLRAGI